MKTEVTNKIRTVLYVIVCIAFLIGLCLSAAAENKAATDPTRIQVTIVDKTCRTEPDDWSYGTKYCIDYTYEIKNPTKSDWCALTIKTYVYDKNGTSLGTLTTDFGSSGSGEFRIRSGETMTKVAHFENSDPDAFYQQLYQSDLENLTFESEVSYGTYIRK